MFSLRLGFLHKSVSSRELNVSHQSPLAAEALRVDDLLQELEPNVELRIGRITFSNLLNTQSRQQMKTIIEID